MHIMHKHNPAAMYTDAASYAIGRLIPGRNL